MPKLTKWPQSNWDQNGQDYENDADCRKNQQVENGTNGQLTRKPK